MDTTTLNVGDRVKVQVERQFAHGRHWRGGWYAGRVVGVVRYAADFPHPGYPERDHLVVETRDGSVWESCSPSCVRAA